MTESAIEIRRLVGKFALLFAFIYVLVLVGGIVALVQHVSVPIITWPLVLLPGAAFVPAVVDAIRLHRTLDPERLRDLWRRCAMYTVIGMVLLVATAIILSKVNGS